MALDVIVQHLNDILAERKQLTPKKKSQDEMEVDLAKPEFKELNE